MNGVNKVILIGTLGRDPEVKHSANGNAVCNLSLATAEQWKDKDTGEKKEKTEWHRVVMFGKQGEVAGKYLTKGGRVYIEGKLQTRQWDKDGEKRYITEVVGQQMQMLGGGKGKASNEASLNMGASAPSEPGEDDFPF